MIVLDTNVISEMMRSAPSPLVIGWLDARASSGLFSTSVTEAEVRYGIEVLPPGRRRQALADAVDRIFSDLLRGRVIPFDRDAAAPYALIGARRRAAGRAISQFDCQIAAIVRSRGASLATRNIDDFTDCGIAVVDPWTGS